MLGLWGSFDLKRVMVSLGKTNPRRSWAMSEKSMDFKWIAEGDPENGRLRRPVQQLNTGTGSCGENPAAVERFFGIDSGNSG